MKLNSWQPGWKNRDLARDHVVAVGQLRVDLAHSNKATLNAIEADPQYDVLSWENLVGEVDEVDERTPRPRRERMVLPSRQRHYKPNVAEKNKRKAYLKAKGVTDRKAHELAAVDENISREKIIGRIVKWQRALPKA